MSSPRTPLRIFVALISAAVASAVSADSVAYAAARLIFPVANTRITSAFGTRVHPVTQQADFHTGLDLAAVLNQNVRTVNSGVVIQAGPRGLLGNAVEVRDAKARISTIYGHLNSVSVNLGQQVSRGQVIGLAGSTGRSTGVHVHFTVKRNGLIADPVPYLNGIARNGRLIASAQHYIGAPSSPRGPAAAGADAAKAARQAKLASAEAARQAKIKLAQAKAAAEKARHELAAAKEAVLTAQKESDEYTYLFNEGAISRNAAQAKQSALRAAQERVAQAQKKVQASA